MSKQEKLALLLPLDFFIIVIVRYAFDAGVLRSILWMIHSTAIAIFLAVLFYKNERDEIARLHSVSLNVKRMYEISHIGLLVSSFIGPLADVLYWINTQNHYYRPISITMTLTGAAFLIAIIIIRRHMNKKNRIKEEEQSAG